MTKPRILLTGAAGLIGSHIAPLLREEFALRLLDSDPVEAQGDDEAVRADIRDLEACRGACRGVEAVVHLAAVPTEDDFESKLLPINILGTYQVFTAARLEGVRRVVYASTIQTSMGHPREVMVTPDMPARPISVYACTKLFGEALARYHADTYNMSFICLRIGWFQSEESDAVGDNPDALNKWVSPSDLAQIIVKSLRSDVDYAVLFALSNDPESHWDLATSRETVGYVPQDSPTDQDAPRQ